MMKKAYIKLMILTFPFILLFAFSFIHDQYTKFAYHKITLSCNGDFIYHRICEDTTPINVAFMGTSKTTNGINDLLIRFSYEYYLHRTLNPVVLSFCGGGRNIQYSILKMLFEHKNPDVLFLEVNEFEVNEGHESYGVLAEVCDLFFPQFFNPIHYLRDIGEGFAGRLDFIRSGFKIDSIGPLPDHGFLPYVHKGDSLMLMQYKNSKRESKNKTSQSPSLNKLPSLTYVKRIVEMANQHDCKVIFLYLPSFGYNGNPIQNVDFYQELGEIWYPPRDILDNTAYWHDTWHFSRQGADSTTAWLIKRMQEPEFDRLVRK